MGQPSGIAQSAEAMHLKMQQAIRQDAAPDGRLQVRLALLQQQVARLEREKAAIAAERDALRERLISFAEGPVPAGAD
jgi:hypothetical protein